MTKKELETKIYRLEAKQYKQDSKIEQLLGYLKNLDDNLTIDQAKKRDYIVRTNYLGKITHKQIKDDFKKEIEKVCEDNFDSITTKLLNYEFYFENKNILNLFSETLQKYEYKQIVLDNYREKKIEK